MPPLLRIGKRLLWGGGRIRDFEIIRQDCGRRPPAGDVTDATVVRDAKYEGTLRTLAAKSRQRAPNRNDDILKQVVAVGGVARIARGDAAQRPPICGEQSLETTIQIEL